MRNTYYVTCEILIEIEEPPGYDRPWENTTKDIKEAIEKKLERCSDLPSEQPTTELMQIFDISFP